MAFYNRILQRPVSSVMIITLVGMGFGLLVHVKLIPTRFNLSSTADALVTALKVTLLVDTVFREGAKFSLIPLFVTQKKALSRAAYQHWTNALLNFSLCVGIVMMLLVEAGAPWIAARLLRGPAIVARSEMITLLRLCAPLIIFGCGSTILGAYLNSQKRFRLVALRNALPAGFATITFLLFWHTSPLAWWVVIAYTGGFTGYFGLLCFGIYQTGHRYQLTWFSAEILKSLKNTMSLPTLGFAIRRVLSGLLVEVYLVGKIGTGAITRYNSAFRIFSAIQTVIGISIATTGLPEMSTHEIEKDKSGLARKIRRNVRTAVLVGIPIFLLLVCQAKAVDALFAAEHYARQISPLLVWLGLGIVFSCMIPVLNAGLYAQKAYRLVFRNMVTMAVLNFGIAALLATMWELIGIALSVSIVALLAVGNLTYLLRKTGVRIWI